jgi:hypothetical protein
MNRIIHFRKYIIGIIFLLITAFSAYGSETISREDWEAAGISEDEVPAETEAFQRYDEKAEEVINNRVDNVNITVVIDDQILQNEDDYLYAVQVDFSSMDDESEGNQEEYLEGDPGIDSDLITVLQEEGYMASAFIYPGQRLVTVTLPGDYKDMYTYTITGTDTLSSEFAGDIIEYQVVNTRDKTYDINIFIEKKEGFVDYLDSDETFPNELNIDELISGDYGESKEAEVEEILNNTNTVTPEEQDQSSIGMWIFIIVVFILISIVGVILYIRYRVNKED